MKCNECPARDDLLRLELRVGGMLRNVKNGVTVDRESVSASLCTIAELIAAAISTLPADEAQREAEADADIAAGRVSGPMTAEEAIARLHKHDTGEWAKDREACEKATGAPWEARTTHAYSGHAVVCQNGNVLNATMLHDDAAFIARARTRWPAALDEIARLRAENEGVRRRALEDVDKAVADEAKANEHYVTEGEPGCRVTCRAVVLSRVRSAIRALLGGKEVPATHPGEEEVERAARTMHSQQDQMPSRCMGCEWDELRNYEQEKWREAARAVLKERGS